MFLVNLFYLFYYLNVSILFVVFCFFKVVCLWYICNNGKKYLVGRLVGCLVRVNKIYFESFGFFLVFFIEIYIIEVFKYG